MDDLRVAGLLRELGEACLDTLLTSLPAKDLLALIPASGRREASRAFTRDREALRAAVRQMRFPREFDGGQGVAWWSTPVDASAPRLEVASRST